MQDWLKPMLAEKADEVPTGAGWIIEPKLDGWRCIVFKGSGVHTPSAPGIHVYGGRNGSDYTGQLPYLQEELFARLPVGTAIDGELVAQAGFDDVGSIMRSSGAHVPTDARPALSLIAFDVLMVNGQDVRNLSWTDRRKLLDTAYLEDAEHVKRTPWVPASEQAHQVFLDMGLEGSVAKRTDGRYVNRRTRQWVKIKPQTTDEARVIGFEDGTGSLAGMAGAFVVEMLETGVKTTLKCGTTVTHRDATDHPERWLGAVIEIKHHGLNKKSGVPRHPQFLRRRDDR